MLANQSTRLFERNVPSSAPTGRSTTSELEAKPLAEREGSYVRPFKAREEVAIGGACTVARLRVYAVEEPHSRSLP
jgi:hypothetical protein